MPLLAGIAAGLASMAAPAAAGLADGPARLALLPGAAFGLCAILSPTLRCVAGLLLARLPRTEAQWRALNVALALLLAASVVPIRF